MSLLTSLRALYSHPYNQRHPISAAGRWIVWQSAAKLWRRPFTMTVWGDRRFVFYPDSRGSMFLMLNWIMDWEEFLFMSVYLKPGDVFVDVGAHIGTYALWASRFVAATGRVHAFEPDPESHGRLRKNVEINQLANIECFEAVVSDAAGSEYFQTGQDLESHIVSQDHGSAMEKPSVRLDDHMDKFRLPRVDLLKLDVEGAEWLALKGAESSLLSGRIPVIQLEVAGHAHRAGTTDESIVSWLQAIGYVMCRYVPEARELQMTSDPHRQNVLAVKDFDAVQRRICD